MGFEDNTHINPGLGFGSIKNNDVLLKMMNEIYKKRHFIKNDNSCDLTPSPILNTNFLVNNGLIQNNTKQTILNITIYPTEYFCPKDFETFNIKLSSNTYSIHHFDMSWVSDSGLYRHSMQVKLNKFLPLPISKFTAKVITIIKYKGISGLLKIIFQKLEKNEKNL